MGYDRSMPPASPPAPPVATSTPALSAPVSRDLVTRLRRIEGQIGGVIRMIEDGRSCAEIVPQLAAAARALDRAGFKLLADQLKACLRGRDAGLPVMDEHELERLFLTLA